MVEDSLAYGSNIVAGVTPGKGRQRVHGIPVYDTVAAAVEKHRATLSIISVPADRFVLDAALESFDAGMQLCLIMTERVPQLDTSKLLVAARRARLHRHRSQFVGADPSGNCQTWHHRWACGQCASFVYAGACRCAFPQRWHDQRNR